MRNVKHVAFILSIASVLAACSSTKPVEKAPEVVEKPVAPVAQPDTRAVAPVQAQVDELDIPGGKLANRSVYFDFDSYVVREDGKEVVSNHSGYLVKNAQRSILIQGNTDERGGSEYNLALGQKRAEAVRKSMAALGVPEARMEAVSLGEEKPKAEGHTEEAWAQNRRADIVYKAK
ncbi:peptidoglycan-associated lipoprotein Pal [Pseudoduganella sp. OTU4001]|uniref:peptidoglycan-associated lipoprotein Pal n=1 Tax=Pseudoduganella sp. OTU4001 TaxID=3043854 RepID=UPI00313D634D